MSIQRVIIFHGYTASPSDHWFGWLAEQLTALGAAVEIPSLPNSTDPEVEAWVETARETIGTPDRGTAIVGHSLGCVTALHALDRIPGDWRLGALVAVSGFTAPVPPIPELDAFTAAAPDLERARARIDSRAVVLSDNDPLVPPPLTDSLGGALDADRIVVPGAGHFLAADGFIELPALADYLRRLGGGKGRPDRLPA